MIRKTLTILAIATSLTACAPDSHDVTTTDIDVNTVVNTPEISTVATYNGHLKWIECDNYVANMLAMHGAPTYSDHHETSAEYEVLTVDYYFYVETNLRFEVIEYRDGSCKTFTADYNA